MGGKGSKEKAPKEAKKAKKAGKGDDAAPAAPAAAPAAAAPAAEPPSAEEAAAAAPANPTPIGSPKIHKDIAPEIAALPQEEQEKLAEETLRREMEDKAAEEAEQADEAPAEMAETAPAKPPLQVRRSQASFILKSPELIQAAQNGKDDYVQELIDGGANINDKDRLEFTALHWACRYGHIKVAKILVNAGASLDAKARGGKTPRDFASGLVKQWIEDEKL